MFDYSQATAAGLTPRTDDDGNTGWFDAVGDRVRDVDLFLERFLASLIPPPAPAYVPLATPVYAPPAPVFVPPPPPIVTYAPEPAPVVAPFVAPPPVVAPPPAPIIAPAVQAPTFEQFVRNLGYETRTDEDSGQVVLWDPIQAQRVRGASGELDQLREAYAEYNEALDSTGRLRFGSAGYTPAPSADPRLRAPNGSAGGDGTAVVSINGRLYDRRKGDSYTELSKIPLYAQWLQESGVTPGDFIYDPTYGNVSVRSQATGQFWSLVDAKTKAENDANNALSAFSQTIGVAMGISSLVAGGLALAADSAAVIGESAAQAAGEVLAESGYQSLWSELGAHAAENGGSWTNWITQAPAPVIDAVPSWTASDVIAPAAEEIATSAGVEVFPYVAVPDVFPVAELAPVEIVPAAANVTTFAAPDLEPPVQMASAPTPIFDVPPVEVELPPVTVTATPLPAVVTPPAPSVLETIAQAVSTIVQPVVETWTFQPSTRPDDDATTDAHVQVTPYVETPPVTPIAELPPLTAPPVLTGTTPSVIDTTTKVVGTATGAVGAVATIGKLASGGGSSTQATGVTPVVILAPNVSGTGTTTGATDTISTTAASSAALAIAAVLALFAFTN